MPEHMSHLHSEEEELHAIDRELAQMLAVEPSPEFAANVRARIELPTVAAGAWRWWALASVAAAATIAIGVVLFTRSAPEDVRSVRRGEATAAPSRTADLVPSVRPGEAPAAQSRTSDLVRSVRRSQTTVARSRTSSDHTMEVLIDPSLAAAVRRLAGEQPALPEVPPVPSLDPVVVQPLEVPDISDGGTKQGDRQ